MKSEREVLAESLKRIENAADEALSLRELVISNKIDGEPARVASATLKHQLKACELMQHHVKLTRKPSKRNE